MSSVLKCENLCASWKQNEVLRNISLSFDSSSDKKIFCLCGPNGCGKSTLLRLMAGIEMQGMKVSSSVMLDDDFVLSGDSKNKRLQRKQIARKISFLQQEEMPVWNFNVFDYILQGRFCHTKIDGMYSSEDVEVCHKVVSDLKIDGLAHKNIFELSGGEFQKVRIARCFVQQSEFVLMDEPVSNLDPGYCRELLNEIKGFVNVDGKRPVFIVSIHDLNAASMIADEIILMKKIFNSLKNNELNQLTIGRPEFVLTEENLEQTFGSRFGLYSHPEYGCTQVYVK